MKAISIKRLWAEQVMDGTKREEFRTWTTKHRGPLAIHASGPGGALLGVVDVVGCRWDAGRGCYAWQLARPRRLASPILCKGKQKFWNVPAEHLPALEALAARQ